MIYNFPVVERGSVLASFNKDYVLAARHLNP
jgi:hypothetical protein